MNPSSFYCLIKNLVGSQDVQKKQTLWCFKMLKAKFSSILELLWQCNSPVAFLRQQQCGNQSETTTLFLVSEDNLRGKRG